MISVQKHVKKIIKDESGARLMKYMSVVFVRIMYVLRIYNVLCVHSASECGPNIFVTKARNLN